MREWYIDPSTWTAYEPGTSHVDEPNCYHVVEYSVLEAVQAELKATRELLNEWDQDIGKVQEECDQLKKDFEDSLYAHSAEVNKLSVLVKKYRAALEKVIAADPYPDLSTDKYYRAMEYIRGVAKEALHNTLDSSITGERE
jgi:DNA repair ATPase RecN